MPSHFELTREYLSKNKSCAPLCNNDCVEVSLQRSKSRAWLAQNNPTRAKTKTCYGRGFNISIKGTIRKFYVMSNAYALGLDSLNCIELS